MSKLVRYTFVGLIGAIVGLLVAPKPGRELRKELEARFGPRLGEMGLLSPVEDQVRMATVEEGEQALQAKIEETRRRLREQAEGGSEA